MKLITWNCCGAFKNKAEFILEEQADILIVPECRKQDLLHERLSKQSTDTFWYGDTNCKGVGVFSFNDFKIKPLENHNPNFKYVIPLSIYNDKINFTILVVWTQSKKDTGKEYSEHIWEAVLFYTEWLQRDNVVIAGDFNGGIYFDKPNRIFNHSCLVEFLKEKNIISTYHYFHNQTQGEEKDSTFYFQWNVGKPFHIDYCFASQNLIEKLKDVEIGNPEKWLQYSDHMPLIVIFDI